MFLELPGCLFTIASLLINSQHRFEVVLLCVQASLTLIHLLCTLIDFFILRATRNHHHQTENETAETKRS